MPRFMAFIEVWLKEDLVDAEGRTVKEALNDLGYPVLMSRVGKIYRLWIEADDDNKAVEMVDEICKRLLTNPIKDSYSFRVKKYEI